MSEAFGGPFVFDTSAESWFARTTDPAARLWFTAYLEREQVWISAVTALERLHGYSIAIGQEMDPARALRFRGYRASYPGDIERVLPVDLTVAAVAAELLAAVPNPPTPPKRTHRAAETRADRLARWRFDVIIAATALANRMPLMHDNPEDFEALRMALEMRPDRLPGLGPLSLVRCVRAGDAWRYATAPRY